MFNIVTIGGATQDIFLISNSFKVRGDNLLINWGEKFLVDKMVVGVGGGAANSAVGFARLGLKTAFWGKVGQDLPGLVVSKQFKLEGVSKKFLDMDPKIQTSTSAILVGEGGEHTIVMYRGHNDDLLANVNDYSSLIKTEWFYLTDLGGHTERLTNKVLDLVQKNNIKLAFIPGQHHLKLGIRALMPVLKNTEILILNVYEAYTLLRGRFPGQNKNSCQQNIKDIKEMLEEFNALGSKVSVITRDVCGINAFDGKNFYFQEAPLVDKPVDTTGAGDSFSSGFISGIIKGKDLQIALKWGTKNAGSVISYYGAQTGLLKESAF